MTNTELKNLKDTLWQSADTLRADSGLKSSEYATPILGLIFLRFAESKYKQYEEEILAEMWGVPIEEIGNHKLYGTLENYLNKDYKKYNIRK